MASFVVYSLHGIPCGTFLTSVTSQDDPATHAFCWNSLLWITNLRPCFAFYSFTYSSCGETPVRNISCCFLTDSFCLARFMAASSVRPKSIRSFSLSFTFYKLTTIRSRINCPRRVPNWQYSDEENKSVMNASTRSCLSTGHSSPSRNQ